LRRYWVISQSASEESIGALAGQMRIGEWRLPAERLPEKKMLGRVAPTWFVLHSFSYLLDVWSPLTSRVGMRLT
jgi:hypothetical protein